MQVSRLGVNACKPPLEKTNQHLLLRSVRADCYKVTHRSQNSSLITCLDIMCTVLQNFLKPGDAFLSTASILPLKRSEFPRKVQCGVLVHRTAGKRRTLVTIETAGLIIGIAVHAILNASANSSFTQSENVIPLIFSRK